jgi:group I intron endonuclease
MKLEICMPRKRDDARGVSGIYAIRHRETGKLYIGSSLDVGGRWKWHLRDLRAGRHHSPRLQNAWNKHGAEAFDFILVERVEDKAMLVPAEQFWMDFFEASDQGRGYNILPVAGSCLGAKRSEESKAKMSAAHMGVPRLDLRGVPKSAEHKAKLSAAQKGIPKPWVSDWTKGVTRTVESRAKQAASRSMRWVVTSPDGREMPVHNLKAFCREHRLNNGAMVQVARGRRKSYKGWVCRYGAEDQIATETQ